MTGYSNRVEDVLPEGLLADASWLNSQGYSRQLLTHYVATGRLQRPTRGVFRRPRGTPGWEQVVISLQALLGERVVVGGRTALELQGYAHDLPQASRDVHLYSAEPLPPWLGRLGLEVRFLWRNSQRLFRDPHADVAMPGLNWNLDAERTLSASMLVQPWGQWNWPLVLSTPERAVLELLDELPSRETFGQADKLMEAASNLSPRRMQELLAECRSVKVKRLFFFFADRHRHAWLSHLDKARIDLGKGNRLLVKGGKLDPTYKITVPADLDGVR